jgi:hypothetical protein
MHTRIPPIPRAPDGAAAGASPAPSPAASSAADDGALFDAVDDKPQDATTKPAEGQQPAQRPARPDTIPEQFWDAEKGAVRTDDMAKSWRDLRAKISRGEHNPPDKPEAYTVPKVEGVPDGLVGGEKDALWPEIRQAAHAVGITQKQLDALAAPFLKAVAEQAAPADPEVRKAAVEAELAKLGPNGRHVVRDVKGWINGLHANGSFSDEERDALLRVGTAAGVRALAKVRERLGEQPIPTDALTEDGMAETDARRLMREGFAENDEAKLTRARRALAELERNGRLPAR